MHTRQLAAPFDAADVSWLRALVHFQRALINGVLAYDLASFLERAMGPGSKPGPMVILSLPVDEALFQTWEGVLSDLAGLLRSEQELSVEELVQLGSHPWAHPPQGFIDVGGLLSAPGDIHPAHPPGQPHEG